MRFTTRKQFGQRAASRSKWNEAGREWEEDHTWLDDEQQAECVRAHEADTFESPIPTRMISNGEYMPAPQTEKQKQVEARVRELSESASKKLGVDRRRFLASTGGMAAAFLASVFGASLRKLLVTFFGERGLHLIVLPIF